MKAYMSKSGHVKMARYYNRQMVRSKKSGQWALYGFYKNQKESNMKAARQA